MRQTLPQHILLLNPNTTPAATERMERTLRPLLPGGVTLQCRTAQFGARYIACEASYAVAGHAALSLWAQAMVQAQDGGQPVDAVLVGCFGDPGLFAIRESSASPVTGLAEASFIQAARLGRFAIVTGGERWGPMLQRLAANLGFADQLCHIETVAPSGAQLMADPAMAERCLSQACQLAAGRGAQAVILGGAGLAGFAPHVQPACPVPLIDSTVAGLRTLLEGAAPQPQRSTHGLVADWQLPPEAAAASLRDGLAAMSLLRTGR
jgi:Asp/Glu/hydantoin racemase